MSNLADGIQRTSPLPVNPSQMELSKQERELIVSLRLIDFFKYNQSRFALIDWNGMRVRVFDTSQIR